MSLRLDPPITIGPVTVQALSRTRVQTHANGGGVRGFATKTPLAIIVRDATGRRVFNLGYLPLSKAAWALIAGDDPETPE